MGLCFQAAWQSRVREFAQEELRPLADTFDKEKSFPTEQVTTMFHTNKGVIGSPSPRSLP